jgi:hypothetical protein
MPRARTRFPTAVVAGLLAATACTGDDSATPPDDEPAESPTSQAPAEPPTGTPLSQQDIQALAAQFTDNPLTGGQTAPRLYRWVNEDVALFIQFDDSDVSAATALQYIGVSVKGTFCAQSRPGGPDGGFTHFHQLDAPDYAEGHAGPAGTPGYWLTWVAVGNFESFDGRQVEPGVDYEFAPTPEPPSCEADQVEADFDGPGARELDAGSIQALAALFDDMPLTGGQEPPRIYKWVNEDVALFAQFDDSDLTQATSLPYIGISVAGEFCADKQPSPDFPHFHRWHAADYAEGHGESPGDQGAWLLWLATDSFESGDGRQVTPGVDREFSPTPPPDC